MKELLSSSANLLPMITRRLICELYSLSSSFLHLTNCSLSNNLNFPFASISKLLSIYPVPSAAFPTIYNATSGMWRDAHMLCLASNLGKWRTEALGLDVWRYRFDLVADNLNSAGANIGAFHGELSFEAFDASFTGLA